jgi:hypothetical protein
MIHVYLIENYPWVWFSSLNWNDYAKFGEWAWVGREQ